MLTQGRRPDRVRGPPKEEWSVAFGIYLIGYCILIIGLAIGAHLLHAPEMDRGGHPLSGRYRYRPRRDQDERERPHIEGIARP